MLLKRNLLLLAFLAAGCCSVYAQTSGKMTVHIRREENGKVVEYDTTMNIGDALNFNFPGGGGNFSFSDTSFAGSKAMPFGNFGADFGDMQKMLDSMMQMFNGNSMGAFRFPQQPRTFADTSIASSIGHSVMMYDDVKPGTKGNPEVKDLAFYPAASGTKYTLSFTPPEGKSLAISVTGLDGEKVYEEQIGKKFKGNYEHEIDFGSAANGVYYLDIAEGNKNLRKKLIIR